MRFLLLLGLMLSLLGASSASVLAQPAPLTVEALRNAEYPSPPGYQDASFVLNDGATILKPSYLKSDAPPGSYVHPEFYTAAITRVGGRERAVVLLNFYSGARGRVAYMYVFDDNAKPLVDAPELLDDRADIRSVKQDSDGRISLDPIVHPGDALPTQAEVRQYVVRNRMLVRADIRPSATGSGGLAAAPPHRQQLFGVAALALLGAACFGARRLVRRYP